MTADNRDPRHEKGDFEAQALGPGKDTVQVSPGSKEEDEPERLKRKRRASKIVGVDSATRLMATGELPAGSFVGDKYEIRSCLGKGGMSIVYKAWDHLLKRHVAIKVLLPTRAMNSKAIERFMQEAQTTSQLDHANLIKVYEFANPQDGEPYLVMDYLEGWSLNDVMTDRGIEDFDEAIRIMRQIFQGLKHAHKKGVIHRDLKPSNIMLVRSDDGDYQVKIVDFGIAKIQQPDGQGKKLTETGEVFGSPIYMSPEQCRGDKLDARSDIYSLGCVMYEILTGAPPFMGDNFLDTLHLHLYEKHEPLARVRPELPGVKKLDQIMRKALTKEPGDRYQSVDDLIADFESIPLAGERDTADGQDAPMKSRRKLIACLALALLLVFAAKECFDIYQGVAPDRGASGWLASLIGKESTSEASAKNLSLFMHEDRRAQRAFDRGIYDKAKIRYLAALKTAESLYRANEIAPMSAALAGLIDLMEVMSKFEGDREAQKSLSGYQLKALSLFDEEKKKVKELSLALSLNKEAFQTKDRTARERLLKEAAEAVEPKPEKAIQGASKIFIQQARYFVSQNQPERGKQLLEKKAAEYEAAGLKFAEDRALCLFTLAGIENESAQPEKARQLFEEAATVAKVSLPVDSPVRLVTSGTVKLWQGELSQAHRVLADALAGIESQVEKDDQKLAPALEILAQCNTEMHRKKLEFTRSAGIASEQKEASDLVDADDDESEEFMTMRAAALMKRAVAVRLRAMPQDSRSILNDFGELANLYIMTKEHDKLERVLVAALEYTRQMETESSVHRALWLNNLASIKEDGDMEKARSLYRQSLECLERAGLTNDRLLRSILTGLARAESSAGNAGEAERLTRRADSLSAKR